MNEEIWKDIPEYERIYQASTYGRIRTKEGKTTFSKRHGIRHWKSRVLKPRGINPITGNRASLWRDGACKDWLVARLIGITFLGVPENEMTINHKDGNRFNNNLDNLEWLTLGDNIRHAFENDLVHTQHHVKLIESDGTEHLFKSKVKAGKYIGRGSAYISLCVTKSRKANGIDNKKYEIICLKDE